MLPPAAYEAVCCSRRTVVVARIAASQTAYFKYRFCQCGTKNRRRLVAMAQELPTDSRGMGLRVRWGPSRGAPRSSKWEFLHSEEGWKDS